MAPPHIAARTRVSARAASATVTLCCILAGVLAPALRASASDAPVELGRLPEVPVWLVSAPRHDGSLAAAALTVDGTMWWLSEGAATRLRTGLGGEQAEACDGAIIAVDVLSRLQRFAGAPGSPVAAGAGPPVSLHHRPHCLDAVGEEAGLRPGSFAIVGEGGDVMLLERDLRMTARAADVQALPDVELGHVDLGGDAGAALVVLAEPTQRYRNGVLGDEVEAGAVVLLAIPSLRELARWAPERPAVIEDRRATPWRHGGAVGLHLTVSDDRGGARLVTLAWDGRDLVRAATGPAMGPSGWMHVLVAIEGRVYAQHRPHDGGPVVRYDIVAIVSEATEGGARHQGPTGPRFVGSDLDVTSHVIGERNLDRAAMVRTLAAGIDLLALARPDGRAVVWVRCDANGCREMHETSLAAAVVTNLVPFGPADAPTGLLAGDAAGSVWWLPVPRALGR
jgi:hypothetical protein